MINQKKQDQGKGSVSPVAAAVTGAIIGAGIAVAGAVALSDKKNRKIVKEVLTNVRDQAIGYMEEVQNQAQDKKDEVEKKLTEGKEKVKKLAN